MMDEIDALPRASLRAPRAAAVAGIAFSILFVVVLVLIRISVSADPLEVAKWFPVNWETVGFALQLMPFAGIAFLWFIAVLCDRMAACEDRFFATVFVGSGLLFLAMLFVTAAVAGAMVMVHEASPDKEVEPNIYTLGRALTYKIMNVYAMKMAGVFMIATSTASIRTGIFPRWMALLGYGTAILLLFGLEYFHWMPLVFPLWVLLISVHILFDNLRSRPAGDL
jgi:hypothetical protein